MVHSGAIFMVVAVSAERYRAVCHPMSKRQPCHKFVLFVLAFALMKNIPRFMQFELVTNSDFCKKNLTCLEESLDYVPSPLMENPAYIRFSSYWDEILISGVVPLVSLVFFNTRIYLKVSYTSSV